MYLALVLMCFITFNLKAGIINTEPEAGTTDFELNPTLEFEFDYDIVDTTVTPRSPYPEGQITPSVLLVKTKLYQEYINDFDKMRVYAEEGLIDMIDSRRLSFVLRENEVLDYNTSYTVLINGVVISDGGEYSETVTTVYGDMFTTIPSPPFVGDVSVSNIDRINCKDTIKIYLKSQFDDTEFNLDDIFKIYSLDSITIEETTTTYTIDSVDHVVGNNNTQHLTLMQSSIELAADKKVVSIMPSGGYPNPDIYFLECRINDITGNEYDHYSTSFFVTNQAQINLSVGSSDGTDLPSDLEPFCGTGIFNYVSGKPIELVTPKKYGDLVFDGWSCPGDPFINGNMSNVIQITYDCGEITDKEITALYKQVCIDTVTITGIDPSYVDSLVCFGDIERIDNGIYTIKRFDDTEATIVPSFKNGYKFNGWSDDYPGQISSETPILHMGPMSDAVADCKTNTEINLAFTPVTNCNDFTFCIKAQSKKLLSDNISDFLIVNGITLADNNDVVSTASGCLNPMPATPPINWTMTIQINPFYVDCYEIHKIIVDNQIEEIVVGGTSFQKTITVNDPDNNGCKMNIHVLLVEKETTMTTIVSTYENAPIPFHLQDEIQIIQDDDHGVLIDADQIKDPQTGILKGIKKVYKYPCGTDAKFYPEVMSSDKFSIKSWIDTYEGQTCYNISKDTPKVEYIDVPMNQDRLIVHEFEKDKFHVTKIEFYDPNETQSLISFPFYGATEEEEKVLPQYAVFGLKHNIQGEINSNYKSYINQDLLDVGYMDADILWTNSIQWHNYTGLLRIHFSENVDESSLNSSSLSVLDAGGRLKDNLPTVMRLDNLYPANYGYNPSNCRVVNGNIVEIELVDLQHDGTFSKFDRYFPHISALNVILTDDIRSSNNESLSLVNEELFPVDKYEFELRSDFPGMRVRTKSLMNKDTEGSSCLADGNPEVYGYSYAVIGNIYKDLRIDLLNDDGETCTKYGVYGDQYRGQVQEVNNFDAAVYKLKDDYFVYYKAIAGAQGSTDDPISGTEMRERVEKALTLNDAAKNALSEGKVLSALLAQSGEISKLLIGIAYNTAFWCNDVPLMTNKSALGNRALIWWPMYDISGKGGLYGTSCGDRGQGGGGNFYFEGSDFRFDFRIVVTDITQ